MPGKDADSSSDWDSIVVPAEEPLSAPAPINDNARTTPKPDDPPFDFKSEVRQSSAQVEREAGRPGKSKKGATYEPHNGYRSSDDSADENPIYARVLPKKSPASQRGLSAQKTQKRTPGNDSESGPAVTPSPRARSLTKPTLPVTLSPLPMPRRGREPPRQNEPPRIELDVNATSDEGLMNEAFEAGEDEAAPCPDLQWLDAGKEVPTTGVANPVARNLNSQMTPPEKHPPDYAAVDFETAVDQMLTTTCIWVALPFKFVALFLHHLIRLLLLRILKPLLLDSVTLINDLLFRPVVKGVITPVVSSLVLALTEAGNAVTACISPVLHLLRAFRLVEVNINHSVKPQSVEVPNVTNLLHHV